VCAQEGKVAKPDKLLDDSDSEEEVADVEFQVGETASEASALSRRLTCSSTLGLVPGPLTMRITTAERVSIQQTYTDD